MNRKRYGSFALLLILLTTLIMLLLMTSLYGDGTPYEYKPLRQKYAIANKSQYMNDDFYRNYVLTDAKWAYNSIRFYTDDGVGNVLEDDKLGETELNYSTDKANFTQDYSRDLYDFDPILYKLRTKGDLLVNYCVSLASTSRSSQRADILHYTDYVNRYGNGPFISYGAKEYFRLKGSLTLHYEYNGASFAHAKNHALVFADDIYPDVQSVYATKEIDGSKNFKYVDNDSKIFIHVKYNEPIRFCDNNVKPHDLYLKIKLVNNEGTSVTDSSLLKAKFVRLKDDTLTFEYDIPDKVGGADLDHCITGFDGIIEEYKENNVTYTKNALSSNYPLKVLTYTGELTGHYGPKGLVEYYSNSLITDLAGNPTKSANIPSPEKNIIIDRIPPKITKINFDVEGNKGIYLGPGASFTPKISFSEEIFDHNGILYDYPQVFITKVQIGTNFIFSNEPGRYFDNSGRLVFVKMPILENMKSTGSDNDLNIISIQNTSAVRPKDKGGNALPNYLPLSETPAAEPWIELTKSLKDELVADKFIVDMEAPEITTSLSNSPFYSGVKCKPVLYSYTGSDNADCFYFPFSITDSGAGVRPLGDDDIKKGSFQWVLADGGLDLTKLNFSYAVTDSPEPPAPAEWQAGRFRTEYSFPQIANTQHTADMFLHIRIADLPDLENLSLDGSPVIIKGEDALGNRNSGKWFYFDSSEIKSIFDHNPPEITAQRLYNYKENSKWYFAVDFTFFDKSKIDTDGVYYAWMDKGEEPSESDWQKLSGLGSETQKITAKVTYELEGNKPNDKDLYIKVSDKSFNKNISLGGPYAFSKDLEAPKVEIEASGGITEKAVIKIKAPPQTAITEDAGNQIEIPANIIFRIMEPYTIYSNKTIDTVASAVYDGEVYIENIFDSDDGWTLIGDDSITKNIIDGTYYGEVEVEAYIGYGISTTSSGFNIKNFYDFPVSQEIYSFKLAPGNRKIHDIEMTSSSGLTEDWQSPEDGKKYFNTLSGISFNVSLSNSLMPEWGAKDLDLENSYFALYKEGESEPVYETLLSMSNTITLPDYDYTLGNYTAKVVAKAKTSGREDTAEITGLFVDTTVPGEFGLSKIVTEFTPKENSNAEMLCAKLNENALANPVCFEHQVSETEEEGGDLITMYDKSPYILLGYGENDFVDITRKFYFTTMAPNSELYIKVWNVTDGINESSSKAAASWSKLDKPFETVFVENESSILSAYSPCKIPIIKGKENILRYQICHANGNKSEEKVIIADTSNEVPELTIMLTPDEEVPSNEVKALLTNLYSSTTLEMTPYYFNDESSSSITEVTDEISLPKKEGNWFFTKDNYDNYNILNIKAPYLDNIAPAITLKSSAGEGDGYAIEATITDENKCKIFMKFDNDYMERLNLTDYFPLNIPEGEAVKWEADTPMTTGIYRIEKTDIEGGIKLKIYGVYKYDKDNPGNKSIDISIKAIDDAYNTGENSIAVDNVKNTKPQVNIRTEIIWEIVPYSHSGNPNKTEDSFRTYCVRADFNLPIKNITPVPYYKFNNDYSIEKKFLSMFKDADYTITYNDVFGEYYEEEIAFTIDHANTRYENMNINIYRDSVRKKFSVYAEPVANEGKDFIPANQGSVFTMFDNVYQAAPLYAGHVRALAVHRASVEANDNDKLIIAMMKDFGYGWTLDDRLPLIIVDCPADRTPEPTVNWYYHEFASNTVPEGFTETDNNVDVWLSCPIPIISTNDSVLSHTFIHGEDNSYTFEYEYPDGIMGSITVTLPIDIIEKREEQSMEDIYEHDDSTGVDEEDLIFKDKNPPNALFEINRGYGIKLKDKTYWNPEGNDDLENLLSYATFYSLNTIIMDESKTKMVILAGENPSTQDIIYENASNEVVEGITISGTVIKVSKPADFTVFIIDEYNNKKAYSFTEALWDKLDYIMPFIVSEDVIYEKTGFSEVTAYFTPNDDKTPANNIEILSPTGLTKNSDGKYFLTFTENKSIEVSMRDLAGNIGSGNISVDSIDDIAPVLTLDWWSKGYLDKNTNEIDKKRLTIEKTNQSIMAKIVSDKTIEKVEISSLYDKDVDCKVQDGHESEYITVENEPDGIYISFLKNTYIEISCIALNGKKASIALDVAGIIDKNPPTYDNSLTDDSPEKIKATVNFSNFSEDVYVQGHGESGRLIKKGGSLEKTFFERGAYLFRFTDIAGNTVSENVIVENIDEFSPGILLSGIPKAGEYHKDTITFEATMSEEGELTFNGETKSVNAPVDDDNDGEIQDEECHWVEFKVDQNGSYIIKAVDIAGRETIAYVEIKCFDKIPPTITFKPLTITALSSTDLASLNEMLKSGVTLKDNISDYDKINLTYDKFTSNPAKGQYEIKYTATDEAGNVSKATRYVKIYPADEINVSINDIRTEADSTTTLDKGNLSLTVKKLPLGDNEPYKVYLRKGIWTAGQMKGVSPIADSNSFSINENGYYTLHLVTQNRGNYTTFLYIK